MYCCEIMALFQDSGDSFKGIITSISKTIRKYIRHQRDSQGIGFISLLLDGCYGIISAPECSIDFFPQQSGKAKGYREVPPPDIWYIAPNRNPQSYGLPG